MSTSPPWTHRFCDVGTFPATALVRNLGLSRTSSMRVGLSFNARWAGTFASKTPSIRRKRHHPNATKHATSFTVKNSARQVDPVTLTFIGIARRMKVAAISIDGPLHNHITREDHGR
jgi:hypothetical protein